MELASSSARVDILRGWDNNLLLLVVVCGAFTLVLGFLHGSFFVAFVQVQDDVSVQVLDLLLQVGDALNSVKKMKVNKQFVKKCC